MYVLSLPFLPGTVYIKRYSQLAKLMIQCIVRNLLGMKRLEVVVKVLAEYDDNMVIDDVIDNAIATQPMHKYLD